MRDEEKIIRRKTLHNFERELGRGGRWIGWNDRSSVEKRDPELTAALRRDAEGEWE